MAKRNGIRDAKKQLSCDPKRHFYKSHTIAETIYRVYYEKQNAHQLSISKQTESIQS